MLTASTYRDEYVANQRFLKGDCSATSLSSYFLTITNGYDERTELDEGLPYVKVADVRPDYIDVARSGRICLSSLVEASLNQKPARGDLLITRKGSFGYASVVMESTAFLTSSEVFVCKPKKPELMPLLSLFLNSPSGQMQFRQFSTGTTMPGINQGNLANILIPNFDAVDLAAVAAAYKSRYWAMRFAQILTEAAKRLVEALIEGQITEAQLIDAQQALEATDDSLDRAILARLKTDGLDGGGEPLFPDLDQLYDLLERAPEVEA